MSLDATRWAWQQAIGGPPGAKLVLLALADRADEQHRCFPSVARLVKDTGMHRDTIFASLERLEKAGLLTVIRRNGAGNLYQLNGVDDRHKQSEKSYQSEKPTGRILPPDQSEKSDLNQSEKSDPEPTNEPIELTKKRKAKFDPRICPATINSEAWSEWIDFLTARRKPPTDQTVVLQHRRLAKFDHATQRQMIETSIERGWTGLFDPKPESQFHASNQQRPRPDNSAAGQVRAAVAKSRAERLGAAHGGDAVVIDGEFVRSQVG